MGLRLTKAQRGRSVVRVRIMASRPPTKIYALLGFVMIAFAALLVAIVRGSLWVPREPVAPHRLTAPILALAALTAVVWVMMFAFRNAAVARGTASIRYYELYHPTDAPAGWVERPARAFMNLLEVPVLFYLVCVLMIVTGDFDATQLTLAWVYVAARLVHAIVYIAFNYVPARMIVYVCSCVALIVMWVRFAI
jgi:hypothetical protein